MKIVVTGTRGIPGIQGGVETHCQELYPLIADEQHEIIVVRRPNYAMDRSVQIYKQVTIKDISAPRSKHLEAFVHWKKLQIMPDHSDHITPLHKPVDLSSEFRQYASHHSPVSGHNLQTYCFQIHFQTSSDPYCS
mgnify:CR=1 FL=1